MENLLAYLSANPWALWLAAGALSLVLSRRSQIDSWAEAHPRVAGALKLLRSLGLDPWMLLQSISLIIRGRLPEPPATKPTSKLPPLTVVTLALVCLGLSSCANWKPAARTANDLAADFCALTVSELQGISVDDALETACDTHAKVKPFLDELLRAQQVAGAKVGLKK